MSDVGGIAADRLKSFIERWERLQEEIEGLKADQKEVMAEAKGAGFDVKTIRQVIKLRKLTQAERDEQEALLDIYKAALGMLGDTPLGEAALRKLSPKKEPPSSAPPPAEDGQTDIEDLTAPPCAPPEQEENPDPDPTVEEAREMGRHAAKAGKPVTDNPFPARDPRRAAWDEEWCRAAGSDGMDLPDAWKRTAPKKPAKGSGDDDKKAA